MSGVSVCAFFVSGERVQPSRPMIVSIKTSCFRSKTPAESSCRQSKPDRSSSASYCCHGSCTCTGLPLQAGQYRVFCKRVPQQFFLLGLLVLPGVARGTRVLQFVTKKQEHTTLPSITSDRQRARVKRKNVCKSNGVTRWRELESTYCVTVSARNTGTWAFFFEHRFQPLSI